MSIEKHTVSFDLSVGAVREVSESLSWTDEATLPKAVEANVVGLYPNHTFQTVEGWGCAMTESACWLLSRMTPGDRRAALSRWFGPDGMDARFIRMHIDS